MCYVSSFFAQNTDRGYNRINVAVLTRTHNVCFRANTIPLYTPVLLYVSGFKGVFTTRICYHGVAVFKIIIIKKKTQQKLFPRENGYIPCLHFHNG